MCFIAEAFWWYLVHFTRCFLSMTLYVIFAFYFYFFILFKNCNTVRLLSRMWLWLSIVTESLWKLPVCGCFLFFYFLHFWTLGSVGVLVGIANICQCSHMRERWNSKTFFYSKLLFSSECVFNTRAAFPYWFRPSKCRTAEFENRLLKNMFCARICF